MIPELGHFALILSLLFAATQAAMPALSARAAPIQFALCLLAFLALMAAHLTSDFSVLNVVANSHTLKPLIYKISGVWGNHEGSMLLWVLLLAGYGAAMAHAKLPARALQVQGLLGAGFTAFILFASNPFARLDPAPIDGRDLNPLLQDPTLAIHPPLLYLGAVGFSPVFCLAVSALLEGRIGRDWARKAKSWVLFAWSALSAGIALGSWWAYYELGWGGWWFWDPVENASLMPWLLGTALLHSVIVLEKRNALARWTVLLALLTFSLSMLGTFLVRSGVLTSVHAFALDPGRGVFLLCLLTLFTGGALLLYGLRASRLTSETVFSPLSREGSIVLNNLFLTIAAATVLTGTLYPLIVSALNAGALAVGPPYYTATILPLAVPLIALMGIGPLLQWKTADLKPVLQRLKIAAVLTVTGLLLVAATQGSSPLLALPMIALSFWLVTATMAEWAGRAGLNKNQTKAQIRTRIKNMSPGQWGLTLAHAGLGLAIAGMVGTSLWTRDELVLMKPGDVMRIGSYALTFKSVAPAFGENYSALRATLAVSKDGGSTTAFTLYPEKRHYPVAQKETTQAAIRTSWHDDLYATIGDRDDKTGGWTMRVYVHPLVPFLWAGFMLIVAGGLAGFADERKRRELA